MPRTQMSARPEDHGTAFVLGQKVPDEIADAMAGIGTGSMINLPQQLIVMALSDFSKEDLAAFEGPARFRVWRGRNFMLISPVFQGFGFDIIWSPLIARWSGEPGMQKPAEDEHMLFNFVLVDGDLVIRGLRSATVSNEVAMAIWRTRRELDSTPVTADALQAEMAALFRQYPAGIPDTFFHAACDFGD